MTRDPGSPRTSTATSLARLRRGLCAVLAGSIAALACAAPAPALAAGEPRIIAAGIDATDRFIVSWSLEPDTTFEFLEVSSVAISNPFTPTEFAGRNVVSSACVLPGEGCTGPPGLTAYRSTDRVSRDRRYFVRITARRSGRGLVTSDTWVMDQTKPLLPGGGRPTAAPTNQPVLGQPYAAPGRNTIPKPRLTLQSPPKTIAAVIRDGVRVSVDCPVYVCYAIVALQLGKETLVFSDATPRPNTRASFILRPRPARRALLQRRKRARLQVLGDISQPGGKRSELTRRFTVRR